MATSVFGEDAIESQKNDPESIMNENKPIKRREKDENRKKMETVE